MHAGRQQVRKGYLRGCHKDHSSHHNYHLCAEWSDHVVKLYIRSTAYTGYDYQSWTPSHCQNKSSGLSRIVTYVHTDWQKTWEWRPRILAQKQSMAVLGWITSFKFNHFVAKNWSIKIVTVYFILNSETLFNKTWWTPKYNCINFAPIPVTHSSDSFQWRNVFIL